MRITCLICSDLFDGINNQTATQCGHIFHELCLLQWLEKSKTCPSCRQHVAAKTLIRLYFDLSEEPDVSQETLENEVESLKAICKQKDMEKRKLMEQMDLLREFVVKAEGERDAYKEKYFEKKTFTIGLQAQVKDLMKENAEMKKMGEENMKMQDQLNHFRNIQLIIDGSSQDVEEMLQDVQNDDTVHLKEMATYCIILKRQFLKLTELKSKLKNEIHDLKKDLGTKSIQINQMKAQINELNNLVDKHRETIEHLEKEKDSSIENQKQIEAVATHSRDRKKNQRVSHEVSTESSPSEQYARTPTSSKMTEDENTPMVAKKPKINMVSSFKISNSGPSHLTTARPTLSQKILPHLPRLASTENTSHIREGYDGLGGHSRYISRSTGILRKRSRTRKST